jgi:hypothetical protein
VQLIAMRPLEQPGEVWITLQNLSSQRQPLRWPPGWRIQPEPTSEPCPNSADQLKPWQLASFRVSTPQTS